MRFPLKTFVYCIAVSIININGLDIPGLPMSLPDSIPGGLPSGLPSGLPGGIPNPDLPLDPTEFAAAVDACKDNVDLSPEDLLEVAQQKIPKSRAGMCMAGCIQKHAGIITADNRINLNVLENKLKPLQKTNGPVYQFTMKTCRECANAGSREKDDCEAFKKIRSCIHKKKEEAKKHIQDSARNPVGK